MPNPPIASPAPSLPQRDGSCRECHVRRQQLGGLCRQCGRSAGLYDPHRALVPVTKFNIAAEALRRPLVEAPASLREVHDRGVVFDVVWDGSVR